MDQFGTEGAPMETWRDFRAALVRLMEDGAVAVGQLVRISDPALQRASGPALRPIKRATVYDYRKDVNARVGSGNWDPIRNLLEAIGYVAAKNNRPVDIDLRHWESSWQRLEDRNVSRRPGARLDEEFLPRPPHDAQDSWIGGWDGAADAVLAHTSAREFSAWPPGQARLDSLSQAVARLSAAYEPELAKDAAQRLVDGAIAEFGESNVRTLAARHALAFWTGHTGNVQQALEFTIQLNADCKHHLGTDHILTRMARLRRALWLSHMGQWREANRVYIDAVRDEDTQPDRDQHLWLLARWGMARTGGRSGNWPHAAAELKALLPEVIELYGSDHPTALDARNSHAAAVGRAGDAVRASTLLSALADHADSVLQPSHPTALRIRIALAFWTRRATSAAESLHLARAVRQQCESLLGSDHPLSIMAVENEAISELGLDQDKALSMFRLVWERRERRFGNGHPLTLQTQLNYAAARATVQGPGPVVTVFRDLARELGNVLGNDHPETLRAQVNLAISTLGTEGARAAMPLAVRTVHSLTMVLGDDHPETVAAAKLLENIKLRLQDKRPPNSTESSNHSYNTFYGDEASSDRRLKRQVAQISWRNLSDSAAEEPQTVEAIPGDSRPQALDGYDVLRAVVSLPVSTWSYRGDGDVRHLGPMAQDWHAALGLGPDDQTIHMVDVNGVSVVALQALYRMVQGLQAEVSELRHRSSGERVDSD
ncbi:hypothetical protein ACIQPR_09020 [Streptomyces sp. NPDC091280]|uniref:hypothetical protein n=1 Tax=Streptomyces sp. NPDC091280 TaxID=3365984 RepID=UPI0038203C78